MQPEQKIIAEWIERPRKRLGWSLGQWADNAGIKAATTVTRAVKEDYPSITSVKTLHALAKAAGETSVLDFLQGDQVAEKELEPAPASVISPSAESLTMLLGAILPLAPRGRQTAQSLKVVAAALQHGLELLADRDANPDGEAAVGRAAREAVARFHDLTRQ